MENKINFKVESITLIKNLGVVIFAKTLTDSNLTVKSGLYLNGCKIKNGHTPRALDKNGNARTDLWGFVLNSSVDQSKFKIGDLVELSQ